MRMTELQQTPRDTKNESAPAPDREEGAGAVSPFPDAADSGGSPPTADFSREVELSRSRVLRAFFWVAGTLSVAVAAIGLVLPVLPTTPFLIVAAMCYAKGSTRFYNWLLNHRLFGSTIRAWRFHRGVPRRARLVATVTVVFCFAVSLFFVPILGVQIGLGVVAATLLFFMWRLPVIEIDALGMPKGKPPHIDSTRS